MEHVDVSCLPGLPGVAMSRLVRGADAEHVRVDLAVVEPGASLPR